MGVRGPAGTRDAVLFRRPGARELRVLADALRTETVGGGLLLAATVVALVLANTGARTWYEHLRHLAIGPSALLLHLTLEEWAADGLLAIFFFIAGLELKRELVAGEMRHLSAALVPVAAALGGMILPALIYLAVNLGHPTAKGWAIPAATDLAFALAVLAVTGRFLPPALRAFLLTLAVVDDIGAIVVIAVAYTASISPLPLAGAAALLAVFWVLQRIRLTSGWITIPLAIVIWALVHASGVHATVAGVALGLLIPVTPARPAETAAAAAETRAGPARPAESPAAAAQAQTSAERLEHLIRPVSAGLAVPAFALLSAGLTISAGSLSRVVTGRIGIGVLAGLIAGKSLGVFGSAYAAARFTRARLSPELTWGDVFAVSVLSGIGFTVSLLISDLAFGADSGRAGDAKTAVVMASLIASLLAGALLAARNSHYRHLRAPAAGPDDASPDQASPDHPSSGTGESEI
jgi:NhaA family Na+:H+ antiporter